MQLKLCPKCKKEKTVPFEIYQKELKEPVFDVANVKLIGFIASRIFSNVSISMASTSSI